MAKGGAGSLIGAGIWKTVLFIFVSPIMGFLLGSLMVVAVSHLFRRATPSRVDRWFRRLQLVSAGAYSLGHGGNDAQKTIGIIWMLLIATGIHRRGRLQSAGLGHHRLLFLRSRMGTMFGGWRIVKTMGQKITKLRPVDGFCAETGGAITLFWRRRWAFRCRPRTPSPEPSSAWARPVGASAVRWGVAGNIVWAWIFTIPASAFVAAIVYWASLQIF